MNLVWKLLTPLLFSLARRFGPRVTGLDPARLARGKRRLGAAVGLVLLSAVFFVAAVLLTVIDLAVQYEQHGEITWNAILWICVGLWMSGMASAIGAKTALPSFSDFSPFVPKGGTKSGAGSHSLPAEGTTRPPRRPEYAHW